MSSKKARRRDRREHSKEEGRGGLSPVTLFILGIGVALVITAAVTMVFTDRSDRGERPHPGAVWSEAHGHWH
jgi:hypothetical protein